jgi:SAM-dependent methyltransferase
MEAKSASDLQENLQLSTFLTLLHDLQIKGYNHLCPTPETQQWALTKRQKLAGGSQLFAKTLQDIWGWSLPVKRDVAENLLSQSLVNSLILIEAFRFSKSDPTVLRPQIRVSGLFPFAKAPNYYIHSSWPTSSSDSVFFGPESYRFTRYISSVASRIPNCLLAIDVCSGAGVGAFQLARSYPQARVIGLDINKKAIEISKINSRHLFPERPSSAQIDMIVSDGFTSVLEEVRGQVDVVTINPPFIAGDKRTYASGGPTGMELIMRMIGQAREVLRTGGELYGHMAAPCSFDGTDKFREALGAMPGWEIGAYDVLDVDIFGDEMASPENYPDIARLASVGLVLKKVA